MVRIYFGPFDESEAAWEPGNAPLDETGCEVARCVVRMFPQRHGRDGLYRQAQPRGKLEQKSTGFLNFGTELQNPNFAAMAEAVGVRGIRIEDPADVDAGIAAVFAHDGPVLIDAVVNRLELAMPSSITAEMAKGFTLYMVKAVVSGKADEVIDLARTNLWR